MELCSAKKVAYENGEPKIEIEMGIMGFSRSNIKAEKNSVFEYEKFVLTAVLSRGSATAFSDPTFAVKMHLKKRGSLDTK